MLGLHVLDVLAIVLYFGIVIGIGVMANRRVKNEEDYFMGGRKFGKFVSVFLSFGVGTSSDTAISASRETFRLGMSGIWVQLLWLFITPFYWIVAPWYRRLRVLTGGDYFQQRFRNNTLTGLYVVVGLLYLMFYIAIGLTAIGKTVEIVTIKPETELTQVERNNVSLYSEYKELSATNKNLTSLEEKRLNELEPLVKSGEIKAYYSHLNTKSSVPVIALIILIYGVLGGLFAAAWTDSLQGVLILVLSFLLLPVGLQQVGWFSGLHLAAPDFMFKIIGSEATSEYTWHYILALTLMNLVGIVAQPHIFATGGGGAKDELTARIGLVFGNYLKRFTTIMWGFTGVVAFVLFGNLVSDPDMIWGYATSQLLGPGFVGLMIACLLAAAMSSADAFMICGSALFTHNLYRPLFPNKNDKHYVLVGRVVSAGMILGAIALSLYFNNVLSLIKYIWQLPVIFGAVFWVSIMWRRVTTPAALITVVYSWIMIVMLPNILPQINWIQSHEYARYLAYPNLFVLHALGVNLGQISHSMLMTMTFLLDIIMPFFLLFVLSQFSSAPDKATIQSVFARLRTPVSLNPRHDEELIRKYEDDPHAYDSKKMFPNSNWEIMKPDRVTVLGFWGCFAIALAVLGFAVLIGNVSWP